MYLAPNWDKITTRKLSFERKMSSLESEALALTFQFIRD